MNESNNSSGQTGRDHFVGLSLAALILVAWLANHIATIFFIDWSVQRWPWAIAAIALQTWLSVGLFIIAHDAMHGSLAPGRPRLNWWIGQIFVGLYAGFSYDKLYENHHAHHRNPGTLDDPDFDVGHSRIFWPWFLKFFRTYFGRREFRFLSAALLVYALILRERTPLTLVFWGLPAILSALQLFYFGTYLPHHVGDEPFSDQHRTRSNDFSTILSLMTCFHFGYHHEHHDKPWAPWWRLPEIRASVKSSP